MDQGETWRAGRLGTGHIVLDGSEAPPPPKGHSPQFSAHICYGQMAGWTKMPLRVEVGLRPGDFVLDGDPAPLPKKGADPQFSAHVYCGQRAGWIKMALGTELGLGPGHIVLDGDPAPLPQKWDRPPIFGPCLLWPNGWMDQDATWYGDRPRPRPHCVRWRLSSPTKKRGRDPNFRPMSIVTKRLNGSRWHWTWRWASVQAALC